MCTDMMTGVIRVGEGAFNLSYGDFGSALFHESRHYLQFQRSQGMLSGSFYSSAYGGAATEVEAYRATLNPSLNPFHGISTPDRINGWTSILRQYEDKLMPPLSPAVRAVP